MLTAAPGQATQMLRWQSSTQSVRSWPVREHLFKDLGGNGQQGDRTVGFRDRVVASARFGDRCDLRMLPNARVVADSEAGGEKGQEVWAQDIPALLNNNGWV